MASPWVLLLAVTCFVSTADTVTKLGEMSPSNPLLATGDTLVINCTLRGDVTGVATGSRPADDIFFTVGLERLPSQYVHTVDRLTAQLRWPNMTRRHSDSHVFCYWHNLTYFVSGEAIRVADMPKKPNITDCRVYNWNRMVCQWEPAVQDTGIDTNQTLYWTLLKDSDDQWYPCERQTRNTCEWSDEEEDFLHLIHDYRVVVRVTSLLLPLPLFSNVERIVPDQRGKNILLRSDYKNTVCRPSSDHVWRDVTCHLSQPINLSEAVMSIRSVYLAVKLCVGNLLATACAVFQPADTIESLVQPNPPHSINIITNTLSLVTLAWQLSHDSRFPVIFRWNYTSQWTSTLVSVLTDGLTLNLTGLTPHTSYSLTVETRPGKLTKQTGYWSEPVSLTLLTATDVPGAAPLVSDGAYSVEEVSTGRQVTLYWQELAAKARHGVINYTVSVYCSDSSSSVAPCATRTVPGDRLFDRWTLPASDQSYSVTVEAVTSAGRNASLSLHAVTLLAPPVTAQLAVSRARHFVAVRDRVSGEVSLSWQPPLSPSLPIAGYTIYWCQTPVDALLCKSGLRWLHLPANQTAYSHIVTSPEKSEKQQFASSVEYLRPTGSGSVSSGLHWSLCTYDLYRPLAVPNQLTVNERLGDTSLALVVTWYKPSCTASGYIAAYELLYNDTNTCSNVTVNVAVPSDDSDRVQYKYELTDVTVGNQYEVRVRSVSSHTTSRWSDPVTITVTKQQGVSGIVMAAAVLSVIALAVVLLVLLLRFKRPQCCRGYATNMPVPTPTTAYTSAYTDYHEYQLDDDPLTNGRLTRNNVLLERTSLMEEQTQINGSLSAATFNRHTLSPQHNGGRQAANGEGRSMTSDGQEDEALLASGVSDIIGGGQGLTSDGLQRRGLSPGEEQEALLSASDSIMAGDSPLQLPGNRQQASASASTYLTKEERVADPTPGVVELAAYSQVSVHLLPNARGYVENALFDNEPAPPESDSESDLHLNNNKSPTVSGMSGSSRAAQSVPSAGYVANCNG